MYVFFVVGGGSVRFAAGLKRVQWCSQRGCGLWQGDNGRGRRIRTDHGGGILSTGVKKEELCTVTQLAVVSRFRTCSQLLCDFWRDYSCVFQCCSHLWCEIVHSCERGTYGQLAAVPFPDVFTATVLSKLQVWFLAFLQGLLWCFPVMFTPIPWNCSQLWKRYLSRILVLGERWSLAVQFGNLVFFMLYPLLYIFFSV